MDEQRDSTRRILKLNRIRFELDISWIIPPPFFFIIEIDWTGINNNYN